MGTYEDEILEFIKEKERNEETPATVNDIVESDEINVDNRQTPINNLNTLETIREEIVSRPIEGTTYFATTQNYIEEHLIANHDLADDIREAFEEIDKLSAFDKTNVPKRFIAEIIGRDPESDIFNQIFRAIAKEFEWSEPSDEEVQRNMDITKWMIIESLRYYNHWHQFNSVQPVNNENLEIAKERIEDYHDRNMELLHDFKVLEYEKDGYGIKKRAKVEAPDKMKRFLPKPVFKVDIEIPEENEKAIKQEHHEKYGSDVEKVSDEEDN